MKPEFSNSTACVIAWKWIYIFHMPLFVFISGYFSRKKNKKVFWLSIWKLLKPLIIFQSIAILIFKSNVSFIDIITPWYVLWYLLSLIYWRLMLQMIPNKILNNKKSIIIFTFCISILAGFSPLNTIMSMQRTLSFMPFFFLGYCMRDKNIFLPNRYKPLCLIFLLLTISIPFLFPQYLGSMLHAGPYKSILAAIKRILVFSLSIPISFAFINVCFNNHRIAKQGMMTMQYYIYHAFMVTILMTTIDKLNISVSFIHAIAFSLAIISVIGMLLHLSFFRKLTNLTSY